MHFESISDLISMGGYGAYVWGAFGITFFSMLLLTISSVAVGRKVVQEIKNKQERQSRIEAAQHLENTL